MSTSSSNSSFIVINFYIGYNSVKNTITIFSLCICYNKPLKHKNNEFLPKKIIVIGLKEFLPEVKTTAANNSRSLDE